MSVKPALEIAQSFCIFLIQTGYRALESEFLCWVVEDSNLEGCDEHQPSHWASVTPPSGS